MGQPKDKKTYYMDLQGLASQVALVEKNPPMQDM